MFNGFAIAIAWPETLCKAPGSWYDPLLNFVGISENYYYRVGHAAVVLINSSTKNCYYFDFGRYHAPYRYGRVRDQETDWDLEVKAKALIHKSRLDNMEMILNEIQQNPSCHGTGTLQASFCQIDFDKAFLCARKMQDNSPLKYGPFIRNGTNCSRFVRSVILAGEPQFRHQILLRAPLTISPTPMWNVVSLQRNSRGKTNQNWQPAYLWQKLISKTQL
jgi:hypothetical protein